MSSNEGLFKMPSLEHIDVNRFKSFGEIVTAHFSELMQVPGLVPAYRAGLIKNFDYYIRVSAAGTPVDPNDPDDALFRQITKEERERLVSSDGVLATTKVTTIIGRGCLYQLSQLGSEGDYIPLTGITVCGATTYGNKFISEPFQPEHAEVVARLAEETDAFLRRK